MINVIIIDNKLVKEFSFPLPNFFDYEKIQYINGKKFTKRQVDIMACLSTSDPLNKSSKEIANLLLREYESEPRPKTITDKGVDSHIISTTQKIGEDYGGPRRTIRKFMRSSEKYHLLEHHRKQIIQRGIFQSVTRFLNKPEDITLKFSQDSKEIEIANHIKKDIEWLWNFSISKPKVEPVKSSIIIDFSVTSDYERFCTSKKEFSKEGTIKVLFYIGKNVDNTTTPKILDYYEGLLHLFKNITPNSNIDSCIKNYKRELSQTDSPSRIKSISIFKPKKRDLYYKATKWVITIFILVGVMFTIMTGNQQPVISNVNIIPSDKLVKRKKELNKLDQVFSIKRQDNQNQIAAIIGIGGAGKTTIARQYANNHKKGIIWEINAKNPETLSSSFAGLAAYLSDCDKENRKIYENIPSPERANIKNIRLINYIKNALKGQKYWVLIFDDLGLSFSEIQDLLFLEKDSCGEGKIIITTRNSNIKFALPPQQIVNIGELSKKERIAFFHKPLNKNNHNISEEDIEYILDKLPPYPLDYSISAHNIILRKISPKEYLKSLYDLNNIPSHLVQRDILSQLGKYKYTREEILKLAVNNLISINTEIIKIMFFLSLIEFKNIPISILTKKWGNKMIELLIYQMASQSLITNESGIGIHKTFSFHECLKEAVLKDYFSKLLKTEKEKVIRESVDVLASFFDELAITTKYISDIKSVNLLIPHIKSLLKYDDIPLVEKARLFDLLAWMSTLVSQYDEAEDYSKKAISIFTKYGTHIQLASARWNLCATYCYRFNFEEEHKLLKENINLFEKHDLTHKKNYGTSLIHYGVTYLYKGNFKKALFYANKGIDVGKSINNHHLIHFGKVYKSYILNEKGEYLKAKEILEETLDYYKKVDNKRHQAWSLFHLAYSNLFLGEYEISIKDLEKAKKIYVDKLGDKFINVSRINALLGLAYALKGDKEKARELLHSCHEIFKNTYGENHPDTASLYQYMGIVEKMFQREKEAKNYFEKAEKIYSTCNSTKGYLSNQIINKVFLKKTSLKKSVH